MPADTACEDAALRMYLRHDRQLCRREVAKYGETGQFAAHHGDFVAGVELRALNAIFVDLVGQFFALGYPKPESREEIGDASEQADAAHVMVVGFAQQRLHQQSARAVAFELRGDADRAYLGKVRAIKVQRSA